MSATALVSVVVPGFITCIYYPNDGRTSVIVNGCGYNTIHASYSFIYLSPALCILKPKLKLKTMLKNFIHLQPRVRQHSNICIFYTQYWFFTMILQDHKSTYFTATNCNVTNTEFLRQNTQFPCVYNMLHKTIRQTGYTIISVITECLGKKSVPYTLEDFEWVI